MSPENWPNISTWKESMEHDFKFPYQATEPYWTPIRNIHKLYAEINFC